MSLQELDVSLEWCVFTLKNEIYNHIESRRCSKNVRHLLGHIFSLGKVGESEELLNYSPLLLTNEYIQSTRKENRELILTIIRLWVAHKQLCVECNVPLLKLIRSSRLSYRLKGEYSTPPKYYDYICDIISRPGLHHITDQIFSYLNYDDVFSCMSTCSMWYNYTTNRRFFWYSVLMKSKELCEGRQVNGVESPLFQITNEHDIDDLIRRSQLMKTYHCKSEFQKKHSPFTLALVEADTRAIKVFFDAGLPRTGLIQSNDPTDVIIDFSYTNKSSNYTAFYTDYIRPVSGIFTAFPNTANLSPFSYACQKGLYDVVESFLLNNPYVGYNLEDDNGLTAITRACLNGKWKVVKLIAEFAKYREIDIDCQTIDGSNCVYYACLKGRLDVIKVLINNGAQLTKLTYDHLTCLHIACSLNLKDRESTRLINYLLHQSSPHFLNLKIENNRTAFMLACEIGNLNAVRVLYKAHTRSIKRGLLSMDITCKTDTGETAYDLAVLNNKSDIKDFLDKSGYQNVKPPRTLTMENLH